MSGVFTDEFIASARDTFSKDDGDESVKLLLEALAGPLGINKHRNFFILDGNDASFIAGTDNNLGSNLDKTPNLIAAMVGNVM